jgi:alkylhydroperoxidase family enzyme
VRGAINTHVTGRATIDPLHREFLLVRIGTLCRSEYEYAAHVRVGRRAGMTDVDFAMILADPGDRVSSDPIKLALLAATDELWRDNRIADANMADFRFPPELR